MSDFENKVEDTLGKAKEGLGDVTGNDDLANEGKADQVKADAKEALSNAGEAVKDAANKVLGAFKKD
ncbi:CsbD family protein [Corynebacterium sp. sy017]|uniref:CsbD family protein n=1 Tax=unclassified Corynebacterium TaxID=2624378 RepID=UPI001185531E|nr:MULTISPECIES: CsbD family protein [unclassified Corynebacterium]MBP3088504.1 CsbD family protein [Corynebacterium sp. sy017]QDZ41925.1 CsbD family protein [Corynebacterium sp. sy039]TSD91809.1 CsbD family protein [Corynebacterium sp. SY003]